MSDDRRRRKLSAPASQVREAVLFLLARRPPSISPAPSFQTWKKGTRSALLCQPSWSGFWLVGAVMKAFQSETWHRRGLGGAAKALSHQERPDNCKQGLGYVPHASQTPTS